MGAITNSWSKDFLILFILIVVFCYTTYGTWAFKAAAGAFIGVYLMYQYKFLHWRKYGIPQTRPRFPMGDVSSIFWKAPGEVLKDLHDRGKGHRFMGVWFLFKPAILIRDPELIKQILVKDFATFHERGIYMNKKYDPLIGHIFFLNGRRWRNTRTKLTPTFTSGKLKAMFPQFLNIANRYEAVLSEMAKEEQIIDVKEMSARFATDLTTLTAFGIETDALTDPFDKFRLMGKKIFQPSFYTVVRSVMPFLVPDLASWIRIITTPREVTEFFMTAIKEIVDFRENNNIQRQDFTDILLGLKRKGSLDDVDGINLDIEGDVEDVKFSFGDLAAEAFVFFVAGFETAAVAISWAIYELAVNTTLQNKTRKEIHHVLNKFEGKLTYAALQEMTYLDQVIEESLRMYPPVPLILRKASKPYTFPDSDFTIPAGTQVHISVHGFHRDPEFFPNPDSFDPDRFHPSEKAMRNHYTYLPFGEGPRNCLGMRYSMMQKKVGIVTMLNKFEFSVVKESPVPLQFDPDSFVFAAKGGMLLKITKYKE